jgi:hypothetical protein
VLRRTQPWFNTLPVMFMEKIESRVSLSVTLFPEQVIVDFKGFIHTTMLQIPGKQSLGTFEAILAV